MAKDTTTSRCQRRVGSGLVGSARLGSPWVASRRLGGLDRPWSAGLYIYIYICNSARVGSVVARLGLVQITSGADREIAVGWDNLGVSSTWFGRHNLLIETAQEQGLVCMKFTGDAASYV